MSGIVKGAKKAVKSVGRFVKKYWKEIVIAAAVVFTAGIATVGFAGFSSAASTMGTWKAVGSTMWAGATSMAGTVGIGSGASGSVAAASGYQGATLLTGAGAQAIGLASQGSGAGAGLMGPPTQAAQGASAVGQYTGPGSSFMGGRGSIFGGGSEGKQASRALAKFPASNMSEQQIAQQVGGGSSPGGAPSGSGAGSSFKRDMAVAAAPSLIQGAGAYMAARGEEKANEPKAMWGVDMKTGESADFGELPGWQNYAANQAPPNFRGGTGLMDFNDYQDYLQNPYGQFGGQRGA